MALRNGQGVKLFPLLAMSVVVAITACGGSGGGSDANNEGSSGDGTQTDTSTENSNSGSSGGTSTVAPQVNCPSAPALVDTSLADTVVGTGSPASCTESALRNAMASGGVIRFDCGADTHTIQLASQLDVTQNTILDGEGKIVLDGGSSTRVLALNSSFEQNSPSLTVQRLNFQNGRSGDTGQDTTSGGAAIYRVGGSLTVIDSQFSNNQAPATGQDIAGGAIYSLGGGETVISGSTFRNNRASNGGAIGNLHNDLTLINTSIQNNAATGSGGNPGNGGNGGGVYIDGNDQDVVMCGVDISNNDANAFGGGVFRVSNNHVGTHNIDRSTIDGNVIPNNALASMAGGLYLQGVEATITATTVSRNQAGHSGGLFIGPGSTLNILNSTIAENESSKSLGGGITMDDSVTGLIKNVTIANNRSSDAQSFAAATVGGAGVRLQNTIIDGHVAGNGYNPISCRDQLLEGSGNIQFPVERVDGGSDDPNALCSNSILIADPALGVLTDNGGDTQTLQPASGSPAIGLASDCPATDQLGEPRSEPCTAGAVEVR